MLKTRSIILCTILVSLLCACQEQFVPAKPSPEQLAFQDLELGVFVHYSIDAYAERGVIPGQTPASDFNPRFNTNLLGLLNLIQQNWM